MIPGSAIIPLNHNHPNHLNHPNHPGESLVSGMIPGSAIAFKANKAKLDSPEVLCYASKSEAMFVPESLIFRSDSNGEDLDGYAGRRGGWRGEGDDGP